ncbi:hypothetical protein HDU96_005241 [Phlyctochytrium bullatum]|nr:hypothetical protein HDU96_005241 [Phlyctochytrium bullatum]
MIQFEPVPDDAPVPSFEWGRCGVVSALLGYFSRFSGFQKLAFRVDSVLYVDFDDPKAALKAAKSHFSLERPSNTVFARIDPPGFSLEEAEGLLDRYSGLIAIVQSGARGCLARYSSIEYAREVVESLRSTTNLVINFSKKQLRIEEDDRAASDAAEDSTLSWNAAKANRLKELQQSTESNGGGAQKGKHGLKEWPAVKMRVPPQGLNVRELFAREAGFLRLLFEDDGARVALFENEANANAALANIDRLFASKLEICTRKMPRRNIEAALTDPSSAIVVRHGASLTEDAIKTLFKSFDGYLSLKSESNNSTVFFSSISQAKKAL